ncbi:hypothetical protein HDV00_008431 [Rhizophlyctis rosea]|nr:hypothetical protein HDV00_008431 [Rhizophlyctis rosea]
MFQGSSNPPWGASARKDPEQKSAPPGDQNLVPHADYAKGPIDPNGPALIPDVFSAPVTKSADDKLEKKKLRKSFGRRVSFAATAHVRLFDKDSDWPNPATPKSNALLSQEDDESPLPVNEGAPFEIPDLSSVRRTSDAFELTLTGNDNQAGSSGADGKDASYEHDIDAENTSFDVHLKGSPGMEHSLQMRNANISMSNAPQPPAFPESTDAPPRLYPDLPPDPIPTQIHFHSAKRDSIAPFFENMRPTPMESFAPPRNTSEKTNEGIASLRDQDAKRPRDSIAAFFPSNAEEDVDEDVGIGASTLAPVGGQPLQNALNPTFYEAQGGYDPELQDESMMSIEEPSATHSEKSVQGITEELQNDILQDTAFLNNNDTIHGFFVNQIIDTKSSAVAPEVSQPVQRKKPLAQLRGPPEENDTIHAFFVNQTHQSRGLDSDDDSFLESPDVIPTKPTPTMSEENDTIGRFFYTGAMDEAPGDKMPLSEYLNDSSDDEGEATTGAANTMDITKCMGGIISSVPVPPTPTDENLAGAHIGGNLADAAISGSPTPNIIQRRQSLRLSAKRSAASPSPASTPVSAKRRRRSMAPPASNDQQEQDEVANRSSPSPYVPPADKQDNQSSAPVSVVDQIMSQDKDEGKGSKEAEDGNDVSMNDRLPEDEDLDDNLMNEQMSFADTSFAALPDVPRLNECEDQPEEPQQLENEDLDAAQILTLKDFLDAVSIDFRDELDIAVRRKTDSFNTGNDTQPVSDVTYSKAEYLWFDELATYEFACKDLTQSIESSRKSLLEADAEISDNPPLIFFDFVDGDAEEKERIMDQLRLTKSVSRNQAKQAWYEWKSKIFAELDQRYKQTGPMLERDADYIAKFSKLLQPMEDEVDGCIKDAEGELEELTTTHLRHEQAQKDEILRLQQSQQELSAKHSELAAELARLESLLSEATNKEEQLNVHKISVQQAINIAEDTCKNTIVFDINDLNSLRDESRLLESMLHWHVTTVTTKQFCLNYDNVVQLVMTKVAGGVRPEIQLSYDPQPNQGKDQAMIEGMGIQRITAILSAVQAGAGLVSSMEDVPKMTDAVSRVWNSLRMIWKDVKRAEEDVHTTFSDSCPMDDVAVSSTFFCRRSRTKFGVTVDCFGDGGKRCYPNGKMTWKVDLEYGAASEDAIDEILRTTQPGDGRLVRAFRRLQEYVEGLGIGGR